MYLLPESEVMRTNRTNKRTSSELTNKQANAAPYSNERAHALFVFCSFTNLPGRGHERCRHLPQPIQLSGLEKRRKADMAKRLGIDAFASFTDIDFLLNLRQYHRAGRALAAVRKALYDIYSERMEACGDPGLSEAI